jgi:hypothetical protein
VRNGREQSVFCLGCGTELPAQATTCAVCGREVGRATGDGEPAALRPAPTPSLAVAASRSLTLSATPAIQPGDLAMPGLPRDAQGRALLITVVAMAADILAPWRVVFGQHVPLTQSGLPALGVLVLVALALAPLTKPIYRHQPSVAVAPLLVGAVSLGVALTYWGFIPQLNSQAAQGINAGGGPDITNLPANIVISPDIGLYLFLLGSGVLILVGYQIFLAAATAAASARSTAVPVAASPATALPLAPDASRGHVAEPAPERASGAAATVVLDVAAHTNMPGINGAAPAIAGANGHSHNHPAPSTPPLPGSIEWHQAPALPQPVRPTRLGSGWARQNGHRGPR